MADKECSDSSCDCLCSNISIMQLFYELKQRYPTVPDQIVNKVIQQNFHDKQTCESILDKENHNYVASYPGALISGTGARDQTGQVPMCSRCPMEAQSPPPNGPLLSKMVAPTRKQCSSCYAPNSKTDCPVRRPSSLNEGDISLAKIPISQLKKEAQSAHLHKSEVSSERFEEEVDVTQESKESCKVVKDVERLEDKKEVISSSETVVSSETEVTRTEAQAEGDATSSGLARCWSVCENGRRCDVVSCNVPRPGSLDLQSPPPLNYQVAVECSLQPWTPSLCPPPPPSTPSDIPQTPRSFTRVNLTLRPPSSEPQPPIEIQSGQGLTYITSSVDPRQGFQSQLQIRIAPVLLERQRERRDRLSVELRRERAKLQTMRNEVKMMEMTLAQKPSPDILPRLQAEIIRLRAECKKLTQAVDQYSGNSENLPLGETNEEFYRNIYTGQRLHRIHTERDASWSCHVCTFRNHELLTMCEECEMPRLMSLGSDARALTLPTHVRPRVSRLPQRVTNVCSNTNSSLRPGGGTSTSGSLTTVPLQERSTAG